jgi:CDGSH-type Zn-finger protein
MVDVDPAAPELEQTDGVPERRIDITRDGPYEVHGGLPLAPVTIIETAHAEPVGIECGEPLATGQRYALCRCGQSQTKPFCDGSHERLGFDGTETADRTPRADRARRIQGRDIAFTDDQPLCTHAGFCTNRTTDVWDMVRDSGDPEVRARLERMIGLCPSGRLALELREGVEPGPPAEPEILLEADGPIWVRGAVTIRAADGSSWETRDHVTLCRCGRSRNKPFCDDTHDEIGFRDGSS